MLISTSSKATGTNKPIPINNSLYFILVVHFLFPMVLVKRAESSARVFLQDALLVSLTKYCIGMTGVSSGTVHGLGEKCCWLAPSEIAALYHSKHSESINHENPNPCLL